MRFEQNSCLTDFYLFGISLPWKYRLPLKTHSTKLPSFSSNWCNFHIDKIKERLVKRQFKRLGKYSPEKLYRTTLRHRETAIKDLLEFAFETPIVSAITSRKLRDA